MVRKKTFWLLITANVFVASLIARSIYHNEQSQNAIEMELLAVELEYEQIVAESKNINEQLVAFVPIKIKPRPQRFWRLNHIDYERGIEVTFQCTTRQVEKLSSFEGDLLEGCDFMGRILGENPVVIQGSLTQRQDIEKFISDLERMWEVRELAKRGIERADDNLQR